MTIAVRNGAYGKNKVEFPTQPFLINKDHFNINNERELQRLREEHVLKMKTMKANWDLEHKKSANDK